MDSNLIELRCRACRFIIGIDLRKPEEEEERENVRKVLFCTKCFLKETRKEYEEKVFPFK